MNYFPEIILPEDLKNFESNHKEIITNQLIRKIEKPKKPEELVKLKEPNKPRSYGFYMFLFPIFFTAVVFAISKYNAILTALTYFGLLAFFIFNIYSERSTYKTLMNEYNDFRKRFPDLQIKYHEEIIEYENKMKNYYVEVENIKRSLNNRYTLLIKRWEYIRNNRLLKSFRPGIKYENKNRGKTEKYFLTYLNKYFPNEIFTDRVIEIFSYEQYNDFLNEKEENAYIPDFVFIHKKSDLTIDIEIDEPYFRDQPTHFQWGIHDQKRNDYFTKWGLVVIRFSEEQIKNDPIGCCVTIANLIRNYTNDQSYSKSLKDFDEVYKHRKWTEEEAKLLMMSNFREIKNGKMEDILKNCR